MTGGDSLDYLFGLEQFGIKLGLDNIRAILAQLGHPERSFRAIHIAGTNGKGSVTAMVDAGLRAAGHHAGRYTSPHLVALNERFVIAGTPVSDADLVSAVDTVRHAVADLQRDGALAVQPTFFEVTTAMAFELFRRAGVEVATVEVGLGGRLDSTNVLLPMATAITSIAFDHEAHLGSTLAAIAAEKAGIIKPAVPVVVGELEAEARAVIEAVAHAQLAPLIHATAADVGARRVALAGEHQRINAAIAMKLLATVDAAGIRVPAAAIDAGLATATWPGRLDRRRLPDGREIVLDAAHNPAGARALADFLAAASLRPPLVFAAMRDKDVRGMFAALLPAVDHVIVTRATNPRSADPAELAGVAAVVAPRTRCVIEASLDRALARAWQANPHILVAGSIFLLGDVMQRLGLH